MRAEIAVVHQVRKQLFESLSTCQASFVYNNAKIIFTIYDVIRIGYTSETTAQMSLVYNVLRNNTTNMVVIAIENIREFTLHDR